MEPTPTPENGRQSRGLARFWPVHGMPVPVQRRSDEDHPVDEPAFDRPAFDRPAFNRSAFDEPAFDEPAFEDPEFDDPEFDGRPPGSPVLGQPGGRPWASGPGQATDDPRPVGNGSDAGPIGEQQPSDPRLAASTADSSATGDPRPTAAAPQRPGAEPDGPGSFGSTDARRHPALTGDTEMVALGSRRAGDARPGPAPTTTDPGTTGSGTTDSGTTDSGTTGSGTTDSGTTGSGTTGSGTTGSGTDSSTTNSSTTGSRPPAAASATPTAAGRASAGPASTRPGAPVSGPRHGGGSAGSTETSSARAPALPPPRTDGYSDEPDDRDARPVGGTYLTEPGDRLDSPGRAGRRGAVESTGDTETVAAVERRVPGQAAGRAGVRDRAGVPTRAEAYGRAEVSRPDGDGYHERPPGVPAGRRSADRDEDAYLPDRQGWSDAAPQADHGPDLPAPMRPGDVEQTRIAFWADQATRQFHEEWHEIKAQFVDDPVTALTRAHDLLTEAVHELTESLLAERDQLDPLRGTSIPDTESMRMAMRDYQEFLDRILAL